MMILIGFVSAQFISELSLINSKEAQFSFQIEFYRYSFIVFSSLIVITAIADDFATAQFESLLSMPLSRWQYLLAQIGAIAVINVFMVMVAGLMLLLQVDLILAINWCASMWMELMLCSFIALLAILSLEKVPTAMMLFISLYILSRASPIILEVIQQSVYYSDGDTINTIVLYIFQLITYILPASDVFVQNDVFFNLSQNVNLLNQALWVLIYALFINAIILFDLYRKEFALKIN